MTLSQLVINERTGKFYDQENQNCYYQHHNYHFEHPTIIGTLLLNTRKTSFLTSEKKMIKLPELEEGGF